MMKGDDFDFVDNPPTADVQIVPEEPGRKFDGDKLRYDLIPPLALDEMVKVLTFGAQKYEPDNWQKVPDSKRRYFAAAQRHLWKYQQGEKLDPESSIHHLAHAMCCIYFLYEHDVKYSVDNTPQT